MRPEKDQLLAAAAETRFPAETLEKVARLGELVVEVGRHPLLAASLALKGGTALNLLAGVPPRLSVDLDFNVIGALEREEMLRARPEIEAAAIRIGRALGYRIQLSREAHAGRKIYFGYVDLFGSPSRIEIDLNFLNRQTLLELIELPLWQPAGLPRPRVRAMALEEIAAGKLCALLDRAAARDLFDTPFIPERLGDAWRGSRFRRLLVASAGVLPRSLDTYDRSRLDRLSAARVEAELRSVLPQGALPSVEELRENAWRIVAPFVALDEPETEFSARLQRGELVPELLFPEDPEIVERLRRHPPLLWKAQNAREHSKKAK
jgi:predicted nucleotidyltransferase component of viral defense system